MPMSEMITHTRPCDYCGEVFEIGDMIVGIHSTKEIIHAKCEPSYDNSFSMVMNTSSPPVKLESMSKK